jgi:hypothetical protein
VEDLSIGETGGPTIRFHSKEVDTDGWVSAYSVSASASGLEATVTVENPGFRPPPSKFFADLSIDWDRPTQTHEWISLSHELRLSSTSDSCGHVSVRAELRGVDGDPWRASCTVFVEAGQLGALSRRASMFFGSSVL